MEFRRVLFRSRLEPTAWSAPAPNRRAGDARRWPSAGGRGGGQLVDVDEEPAVLHPGGVVAQAGAVEGVGVSRVAGAHERFGLTVDVEPAAGIVGIEGTERDPALVRSEEQTSELQSLMRIPY